MRSRWIVLRNFYGWLLDEEEIEVSPLAKVKVEKGDTNPTVTLSDDEIARLLKTCSSKEFLDRRDLALIRFMLATGTRVSEAVGVQVDQVDLVNRVVIVDGKGGRRRLVKFDPATAAALDRYLRIRGRQPKAKMKQLWITRMGALTRKGVQPMLERRAHLAGIRHVHPHMLRHTWADRLKRRGLSDEDLMQLGGWESSEVMRRYGRARAVDRALAAYDEADPMDGI